MKTVRVKVKGSVKESAFLSACGTLFGDVKAHRSFKESMTGNTLLDLEIEDEVDPDLLYAVSNDEMEVLDVMEAKKKKEADDEEGDNEETPDEKKEGGGLANFGKKKAKPFKKEADDESDDESDDEDPEDEDDDEMDKEEKGKKKKESRIFVAKEDFRIPGTDIIVEKGDKFVVTSGS